MSQWIKVVQKDDYDTWYILIHANAFKTDCYFQCLKCEYQWNGSRTRDDKGCPKCEHQYYKWLNYGDLKNKKFK